MSGLQAHFSWGHHLSHTAHALGDTFGREFDALLRERERKKDRVHMGNP